MRKEPHPRTLHLSLSLYPNCWLSLWPEQLGDLLSLSLFVCQWVLRDAHRRQQAHLRPHPQAASRLSPCSQGDSFKTMRSGTLLWEQLSFGCRADSQRRP